MVSENFSQDTLQEGWKLLEKISDLDTMEKLSYEDELSILHTVRAFYKIFPVLEWPKAPLMVSHFLANLSQNRQTLEV